MIHVCYGLNDKTGFYSKFVGTSMLSLFENHSCPPVILPYTFYTTTHYRLIITKNLFIWQGNIIR